MLNAYQLGSIMTLISHILTIFIGKFTLVKTRCVKF